MRIIAGLFGILGVFAALFVVLHLARVQSTTIAPAALPVPAASAASAPAPAPTVRAQSQQIQQNYQQAVEHVMEQSRRQMPEDAK